MLGKAHKYGANVDTDVIMPARYLNVSEAAELAKKAGSRLTQNSVLLGALAAAKDFPVNAQSVVEVLRELVPKKYVEMNVKAFELGRDSVRKEQKRV